MTELEHEKVEMITREILTLAKILKEEKVKTEIVKQMYHIAIAFAELSLCDQPVTRLPEPGMN